MIMRTNALLLACLPALADSFVSEAGDLQCLLQQGWSVTTVSSVDASGTAKKEDDSYPDGWDFGALLQVQQTLKRTQRTQSQSDVRNTFTASFDVPSSSTKVQNATVSDTDANAVMELEAATAKVGRLEAPTNLTALVAFHSDLVAPERSAMSIAELAASETPANLRSASVTNAEGVIVFEVASVVTGIAPAFENQTSFVSAHATTVAQQGSETPSTTDLGPIAVPLGWRNANVADAESVTESEVAAAEITRSRTTSNDTFIVAPHADLAVSEKPETADLKEKLLLGEPNSSVSGDSEDISALIQNFVSVERPLAPIQPSDGASFPAEAFFLLVVLGAYLILSLLFAFGGAAALGASLSQEGQPSRGRGGPPRVPPSRLAPFSRRIYNAWSFFCALLPAQLVVGTPSIFVLLRWQLPEETTSAFLTLAAVWTFLNVAHLALFGGLSLVRLHCCMANCFSEPSMGETTEESSQVTHWVLLPNYQDDLDRLTTTIESVSRSVMGGANIGLVVAMEEREAATIFGRAKAEQLRDRYSSKFREFHLCLRPANVQSTSPGRASNVSWAFDWLLEHLACTNQDTSRALLTVVSPGDELHEMYFKQLAAAYVAEPAETRTLTLWQSPILRLKGYHKQQAPVAVASALNAVASLAVARPRSSYSLSLSLARRVGGWDPEVAEEDVHMGAKCFLLTLGLARVRPLGLPTLQTAPGGLWAFWLERRRQALGAGDAAGYYFATLPLVMAHILVVPEGISFSDFVRVWFGGIPCLAQFMNEHVLPGALAFVALTEPFRSQAYDGSQQLMVGGGSHQVLAGICLFGLLAFVAGSSACVSIAYGEMRKRLWEAERRIAGCDARKEISWDGLHAFAFTRWVYCFARMLSVGVCYFVVLGVAAWAAAAETGAGRAWEQRSSRAKQRPPAADLYAASQEFSEAAPPVHIQR